MAAGKTTVGRRVAELTGTEFMDLDEMVERAQRRSVTEIFEAGGEPVFREAELEAFTAALAPDRVVALGGGAPMQEAIWRRVRAEAVSVFLDVPMETIRARLGEGEGRPLAGGDLDGLLAARLRRYREADHVLDGTRPVETVAEEVAGLWSA